ncbi:uncharacterized protein LOC124111606 isoform X2 [Haliotis rufescens]|uniref:uncharacterized protein LOC124111606 isoform X2 n=1 Tax=Haliotis rufescens TaxID=6454 RepID=UPI00201E9FF7|nr:uncharacterized protein LOC124111606 isoform X2 [Haliotis rufescens]
MSTYTSVDFLNRLIETRLISEQAEAPDTLMDDIDINTGIIPIRHSSLPGQVKLPKRYERVCRETTLNGRTRKISQAHVQKEGLGDRLDDLMQAMLWVKQELILLRQHDILLKRQFFNIQDTIHSLQRPKTEEQTSNQHQSKHHVHFHDMDDYLLDNFVVRPSSSVTLLNDVDETEEDDDTFRPRTCSMRTSRDLAALARRRGSKELV